jgi:DNA primase
LWTVSRTFLVIRAVPGVRFQEVRSLVSMATVLELLGFVGHAQSREENRGPCPVQASTSLKSRNFSANLTRNVYRRFGCGLAGNQFDLYAAATHQSLYAAAIELCARVGCAVAWIEGR